MVSGGASVHCTIIGTSDSVGTVVTVSGQLDMASAPHLDVALRRVDQVVGSLTVALAPSFADSHGLAPVVELSRRRQANGSPGPLLLQHLTPASLRVFHALGVTTAPCLDIASWDRGAHPQSGCSSAIHERG